MRRVAIVLTLCGCGRLGFDAFDPTGDGGGGDAHPPDSHGDGATAQVPDAIAWFKLDENAGMAAYDTVTGEFGLVQGGTWVVGHAGAALAFDGGGDNVAVGPLAVLTNLPQLTVSAWIDPSGLVDDGQPHCVFAKAETTTAGWAMLINQNGNGSLGFESYYAAGTVSKHSAAGTVVASRWQHVVATWTGGADPDSMELYLDGAALAPAIVSFGPVTRPDDSTVSASINCYGNVGLAGTIDEVMIFDQVLTPAQVEALYVP